MFLFASSPSPFTECLVGALDWSHHPKVVSSVGGTTRSRGGHGVRRSACMFEWWFREMEATTDPSTPAFLREVEAPSASPTPVQVPGKMQVIYAPSSSVLAPKGRGSHSSTLSVLVPEGRGSRLLYAVGLGPVVCWVWVLVGFWWKRCYGSCRQGVCSEKG